MDDVLTPRATEKSHDDSLARTAEGRMIVKGQDQPERDGPTGLTLALWLTRPGVGVRVIDKDAEPGTTSRVLVVQARRSSSIARLARRLDAR